MGATVSKGGGNFLDALPPQGTLHVVMLGLDSAGKTTALYRLKFDQYLNTVPTIGFNCEKIQGTVGKAKGVQFLVWDVGGQEKLRPLWRSYTRCTDGILFVVDSVDIERMEEAKMELMRTAKCPDNHGVPLLILANKQDLPGARDPKELEKLLSLNELQYPNINHLISSSSTSTSTPSTTKLACNTITSSSSSSSTSPPILSTITTTTATATITTTAASVIGNDCYVGGARSNAHSTTTSIRSDCGVGSGGSVDDCIGDATTISNISGSGNSSNSSVHNEFTITPTATTGLAVKQRHKQQQQQSHNQQSHSIAVAGSETPVDTTATTTATTPNISLAITKKNQQQQQQHYYKGWHIQPACAITGEGLQEGLEVLYEMILKRRKLNKGFKKKR